MSLVTGIAVYVVVWWIVLFAVLPWGARPSERPEKGHADSAPENPRILLKAFVTTIVAFIVWGIIYLFVALDLISFREMARRP